MREQIIDEFPLSQGQRALWFLQKRSPDSVAYNVLRAGRSRAKLDFCAFRQAIQRVVDRHPALRTTFHEKDGEPVQRVHKQVDVFLHVEDVSDCNPAQLEKHLEKAMFQTFNLEDGPLMRIFVFSQAPDNHLVLLTMHHIITDMWSAALLMHEVGEFYREAMTGQQAKLKPPRGHYCEFVQNQAAILDSIEGERLYQYWQDRLSGELPIMNLPYDRPRAPIQTDLGAAESLHFGKELTKRLRSFSREQGVQLYLTALAVFQVLMYRYCGQEDLLIGFIKSGRTIDMARTMGYFINPIVLRADLSGNPSFTAYISRVRTHIEADFQHDGYPFLSLVERLHPQRDPSRSPLYQVAFLWQKTTRLVDSQRIGAFALGESASGVELGGLNMEPVPLVKRAVQVDLSLMMTEAEDELTATLEYNTDLFDPGTIRRILEHYRALAEAIVTGPGQAISLLPILNAADARRMLVEWNSTQQEYPAHLCLHHLFEAQVEQTPESIAVCDEDRMLTYQELNRRANQLAHFLQRCSVQPGSLVGISIERSLEMIVGLLAILKAGGAYLPLDPNSPPERLSLIMQDAPISVLLSQPQIVQKLPSVRNAAVICPDVLSGEIDRQPVDNPNTNIKPEDRVYILYTSGSTGKPKGVQIPHRAAVNFLTSMQRQPGINPEDILLSVTGLSFDISVLELFLPLITGARVVLASKEAVMDGNLLSKTLAYSRATVMQATPATWQLLIEAGWSGDGNLKILCGGEALPRALANQLLDRGSEVWNLYGPTETTVWSTIAKVPAGTGPVPIGRPIANTQLYILDPSLQPAPIGVAGELFIGGEGLAQGYLNRPELTEEKFIPFPEALLPYVEGIAQQVKSPRLYRTGDLARYRADGSVEFLGRKDYQVKIRGFRVELEEIEAVLKEHPLVRQAVILKQSEQLDGFLVAYLVLANGTQPSPGVLKEYLRSRLPEFMIPSAYVFLDAIPRTPNGKVDRRNLPAPDFVQPQAALPYIPPRTETERKIATVLAEVLKLDRVGLQDNFFELGGHSLLAARVISRLDQAFRIKVPLQSLFEAPTVAGLAERIDTAVWAAQNRTQPSTLLLEDREEIDF